MNLLTALGKILIFPGFFFLGTYSFFLSYYDRKLYARLQNRIGPPWYQPLADALKLIGKETIIPADANRKMFSTIPVFSLAAMAAVFVYIPVWGRESIYYFGGDLIVVLYFLTIPALASFLAGWYSRSIYATVGSTRVLTQMFSYEVPLFMALLAPTLLSGSWSITENLIYYGEHPWHILINIPSFVAVMIAAQCKLERTPFDAPEAETEIVSGPLVEYGGRYLVFFSFAKNCELTVVLSLIAAMFLPFTTGTPWIDFLLYLGKTIVLLSILCLMRAVTARLKIDQIIKFCWKYLMPCTLAQMVLNLILRGVFHI